MILRRRFCCRNTIQCACGWSIWNEFYSVRKKNENFAKTFWLITPKRERKRASFGLVWYVGYFISFYFSWIFSDCSYVMHTNGKDATDSSRISQNFLFLSFLLFCFWNCKTIRERKKEMANFLFFAWIFNKQNN